MLDPFIAPPGSHIRFCEPPYRTRAGWIGRQPFSKCASIVTLLFTRVGNTDQ